MACKDWHDIPAGPVSWIHVATTERGQFPNISVRFLVSLCYHCAKPPCVPACPAGAIIKLKENGVVVVCRETCLGISSCGGICQMACPYGLPQFGTEPDAKMEKCDLCFDRWIEGKKPICVEACPMRALDAAPLGELKLKYGSVEQNKVVGLAFDEVSRPSIVSKAKE